MASRKGFFLGNKTQQFMEEKLYILNQLVKVSKPGIYEGYVKFISNHDDARWYEDYGAEVEDDDDCGFIMTVTEEFVQNVQPLLDTPVPFEKIILRCKDITYGKGTVRGRPFVRTDGDSNIVKLSAAEKGSGPTIDEIIFKSRVLVIDQYQTIDGYTIKSSDDDTLVLELDLG